VPIDDHNTWNWGFSSDVAPLSDLQRERLGPEGIWGDLNENFHAVQNEENRYQFDLERQRKTNFRASMGCETKTPLWSKAWGLLLIVPRKISVIRTQAL